MSNAWSGPAKRAFILHGNGVWIEIYDEAAYEYEHGAKCDVESCFLVVLKSDCDALADARRIAEEAK